LWVGVQGFGEQVLADVGSVSVGGVDEVHAKLDYAPQRRERPVQVRRVTPDSLAGDAHRAEPHPVYGQVSADVDRAGHAGPGGRPPGAPSRGRGGSLTHSISHVQFAISVSRLRVGLVWPAMDLASFLPAACELLAVPSTADRPEELA